MGRSDELLANWLCFEGFTLDLGRRALRHGDDEVALRAKCFDLLVCLARNAGRVVTKDELMSAVWPGLVVTDDSLTRCISDVRQALGDVDQRIVKTVPRRGYVLAAPVSLMDAGAQPQQEMPLQAAPRDVPGSDVIAAAPARPARRRQPLRRLAVAALALSIAAAAWLWWAGPLRAVARPPLSIVVLPLLNRSDDPDQAYFAEGLTEDLTTDLSRIPDSFVIARGTANLYKDRRQAFDLRQIGRELGVLYVLEGSVQRLGDVVRLNLRLVDASTGHELWADRIDGNRHDLAALQSQATGTIARSLHLEMVAAESRRGLELRPANPDARDLVWRALSLQERSTPEANEAARLLLERAVVMDPQSASAWGALATSYINDLSARWINRRGASTEEWLRRAGEAADKALAADPNNLYGLIAQGRIRRARGQPEQSLALAERAIAINRNHAPAWYNLSYSCAQLGRPEDAIAAGLEAIRLSPRDGALGGFMIVIAAAHLYAGRDDQALVWAKRSVAAKPGFSIAHAWLAAAAANLGDKELAAAEIAEFKRLQPDYSLATFRAERHGQNATMLQQREHFYQGLQRAGLLE